MKQQSSYKTIHRTRFKTILVMFGVCASVEFFFLLLDEGAIARPMPLVPAMNAAVGDFLPSAGVVSSVPVVVASITSPSSVGMSPGVAGFITRDRVHGLRSLRMLDLVWPRLVCPLLVYLFESSPLTLV